MSVAVKTTVTNKGTQPYHLLGLRGKSYSIRGGETVTFDYDIWSYLSRYSKKALEKDITKGIIVAKTVVFAGQNNITVSNDGSFTMAPGGLEPEAVVVKPKLPTPKFTSKVLEETGMKVTEQSKDKVTSLLGAEVVEKESKELKDNTAGLTKISESVFKQSANSAVQSTTSSSLFNNDNSKSNSTSIPAKDIDKQIDKLFADRDYDMIYALLCDNYPEHKVTKLGIKKCASFKELKEKFSL